MTPGMFGYSLSRPVQNQEFYYSIFDTCKLIGLYHSLDFVQRTLETIAFVFIYVLRRARA